MSIPIGPVVDPGSGRIYWANGGSINKISYAKLDGSGGGGDLNTTGATVANPHGLALDPETGRIYWANVNAPAISYANVDNTGGGDLNTAGATVNVPVGVAIDPSARRIYWANQAGNKISFANLDGSGGSDLATPGATIMGSRSPVLLEEPSGIGAPGITGGSTAGSVLSCSQGSWAPDLLGSWLYRAPRGLAYSWTRDGAAIPGAGGATYTASAGGAYRCTVTASNPAGSSSQTSPALAVSPSTGGPPPASGPPPATGPPPASPAVPVPPTSAGPAPTSPVQPLSPLAFGANTHVTMSPAARRIRRRGPVKVVFSNGNGFTVTGKLTAQTTKGTAFAVGARARKSVTLKLSKTLRRLLRRDGKLSLRLAATVSDPAGNTRTLRKNVSLRLETD